MTWRAYEMSSEAPVACLAENVNVFDAPTDVDQRHMIVRIDDRFGSQFDLRQMMPIDVVWRQQGFDAPVNGPVIYVQRDLLNASRRLARISDADVDEQVCWRFYGRSDFGGPFGGEIRTATLRRAALAACRVS